MQKEEYVQADFCVEKVDLGIFCPLAVSFSSERVGQHRSSDQERARAVWATTETSYILSGTAHYSFWKFCPVTATPNHCVPTLRWFLWVRECHCYTRLHSNKNHLFLCSSCTTTTHGSRRRPETISTVPGALWTAANSTACSSTSNSLIHASSSAMWSVRASGNTKPHNVRKFWLVGAETFWVTFWLFFCSLTLKELE